MENGKLKMDNEVSDGMKFRYRTDDEMKDSGVEWLGKIPKTWNVVRNKYIFREINKKSDGEDGNLLSVSEYYGVALKKDKISSNDFLTRAETLEGYKCCEENDLVMNIMLAWKKAMGISNYKGIVSPAYCVYRKLDNVIINTKYYHYLFRTDLYASIFKQNSTGIIDSRLRLYPEKFFGIYSYNICKSEQDKIVEFIDEKTSEFDSIISKKEALIQKLEEAKKSLISEVVTGKVKVVKTDDGYELVERKKEEMKDSGVEWLGDIPKEWDIKRLRFLGNLQNGISKSSEEFGFGYPFVSYGDVYRNIELPKDVNGLINSNEIDKKIYSVLEGDVLFTRTSETVDEIGLASTCLDTISEATFAGFLIRFRPNSNRLYKGFSKYYFRCDLNRKFFVKEMNLVTRASLSQNLLNNLAVALPSYGEQIEIYNGLEYKVGSINKSINQILNQIEKLKEAKQSLISEAVTGKIEVLD